MPRRSQLRRSIVSSSYRVPARKRRAIAATTCEVGISPFKRSVSKKLMHPTPQPDLAQTLSHVDGSWTYACAAAKPSRPHPTPFHKRTPPACPQLFAEEMLSLLWIYIFDCRFMPFNAAYTHQYAHEVKPWSSTHPPPLPLSSHLPLLHLSLLKVWRHLVLAVSVHAHHWAAIALLLVANARRHHW